MTYYHDNTDLVKIQYPVQELCAGSGLPSRGQIAPNAYASYVETATYCRYDLDGEPSQLNSGRTMRRSPSSSKMRSSIPRSLRRLPRGAALPGSEKDRKGGAFSFFTPTL